MMVRLKEQSMSDGANQWKHRPTSAPQPASAPSVTASSPYSQRSSSSPFSTQSSFQACVMSTTMIIWTSRKSGEPKRATQAAQAGRQRLVG